MSLSGYWECLCDTVIEKLMQIDQKERLRRKINLPTMQQDVRVCTRAGVRARVFVRVLEKDL